MDKNKIAAHLAEQVASVQVVAPADLEALKAPEGMLIDEVADIPTEVMTARRAGAELPPLPYTNYNGYSDGSEPLYTADQMRDYARAATKPAALEALRVGQQAVPADPVAWMRAGDKDVITDAERTRMAKCDYGHWAEISKGYVTPLYGAALLQEKAAPAEQPDSPQVVKAALEFAHRALNESQPRDIQPTAWARHNAAIDMVFCAMNTSATSAADSVSSGAPSAEYVRDATHEECWSRDEEDFNHLSLGDLLGCHDDLKPGDTVWFGEAVHPKPSQLVNVGGILENMGESAYDIGGEHAEDYPDVTDEQAKELESLIVGWVGRTCPPNFWTVTGIKPYVLTAADFPGGSDDVREGAAS